MTHLLLLILLLLPSPLWAAIAEDAISSSASGTVTGTTHNHTFGASANLAIVCRAVRDISGAVAIDASPPTINGVATTHLIGLTNSGNVVRVDMYYMKAPPTGVQEVVTFPEAATDRHVTMVWSATGAEQTTTFNTTDSAQGSSTNDDVDGIPSAIGELAVMCLSHRSAPTLAADATAPVSLERLDLTDTTGGSNGVTGGLYTEAGDTTSIDMRVDAAASSQWAAVAVSIRAAAASVTRRQAPVFYP